MENEGKRGKSTTAQDNSSSPSQNKAVKGCATMCARLRKVVECVGGCVQRCARLFEAAEGCPGAIEGCASAEQGCPGLYKALRGRTSTVQVLCKVVQGYTRLYVCLQCCTSAERLGCARLCRAAARASKVVQDCGGVCKTAEGCARLCFQAT